MSGETSHSSLPAPAALSTAVVAPPGDAPSVPEAVSDARSRGARVERPPTPRPCLTIVCENYWPEYASTGQLITELAESLAEDFEVEVLASQPKYNSNYARRPSRESRNGVEVRRLPAARFDKGSGPGRLANWLSFLASAAVAVALHGRSPRTYLFVTNPPTAPWAAIVARLLGRPAYVLVYDLYPDLAEAIGAVRRGGLLARGFDFVNKRAFRSARGIIALGEDMRRRLHDKLGPDAPVHVIPNWADGERLRPLPKDASRFARDNGLTGRFVFLYAGNLGLFQDLETLAEAVMSLPGAAAPEPVLAFIGNGGKRRVVEALAARSHRIRVFDYVPYEDLPDLYAAADVGLIALEPGVEKTNVPSKTYSILASGRPFLAVCSGSTDLEALAREGCGVCVPNDTAAVRDAMIRLMADPAARASMGRRARGVFEERFSRRRAAQLYRQLLRGAAPPAVGRQEAA